ncbi:hypothetical protein BDN72DRAFT_819439 [Pluteus cervinus]|uniref:Uncharacterized protein n=1 Tax=Pluteus cervinus TaxID=181527 RepID=A0ACD3AWM3_9AGAR|nr:hypothetical protein BDN72DRAFT_819439 [Pluteus cervinus]
MGSPHQAYIIAKVIPHGRNKPNYRCIGAIHHQWCYGSLPLGAALRFMALIKQKENADIIKEEVKALNGKYGSRLSQPPLIPSVPCPFTNFLMNSAWSVDLTPDPKSGYMYLSNAIDEDAFMRMSEGDNSDGQTVIDVTDPSSPSYCFILSDGDQPITAEEYIRYYYPAGSSDEAEEKVVASTVPGFVGIPVIPIEHLAEAWPTDFKAGQKKAAPPSESISSTAPVELPPLADLMLGPALEQSLLSNNEGELLRLLLPHKIANILKILRTQNPMPDGGVFLLSNILKDTNNQKIVDLSGFYLSNQQVITLIPEDAGVEVINLSHNHAADIDLIEQLLTRHRSLRRLVLLGTQIPDDDVLTLLKTKTEIFYCIESVIHPVFMKPLSTSVIPNAYTHISFTGPWVPSGPSAVGLPFFNSAQIVRALLVYTRMIGDDVDAGIVNSSTMKRSPGSVALGAYPSEKLKDGQTWGERVITYIPRLLQPTEAMKSTEGWKVLWAHAKMDSIRYAFVKTDPEAMAQYAAEKSHQAADSYKDRLYQVYDVRGFFKELELESRPAPPQEELEALLNRFAMLENNPDAFRLLTQEEVYGYLLDPWRMRL